jgi:hypothetical protein
VAEGSGTGRRAADPRCEAADAAGSARCAPGIVLESGAPARQARGAERECCGGRFATRIPILADVELEKPSLRHAGNRGKIGRDS